MQRFFFAALVAATAFVATAANAEEPIAKDVLCSGPKTLHLVIDGHTYTAPKGFWALYSNGVNLYTLQEEAGDTIEQIKTKSTSSHRCE